MVSRKQAKDGRKEILVKRMIAAAAEIDRSVCRQI